MEKKSKFKLGSFIKNCIFSRKEFISLISEFGIDKRTDPEYVFELIKDNAPEAFSQILNLATKTAHVKECVKEYFKQEGL